MKIFKLDYVAATRGFAASKRRGRLGQRRTQRSFDNDRRRRCHS